MRLKQRASAFLALGAAGSLLLTACGNRHSYAELSAAVAVSSPVAGQLQLAASPTAGSQTQAPAGPAPTMAANPGVTSAPGPGTTGAPNPVTTTTTGPATGAPQTAGGKTNAPGSTATAGTSTAPRGASCTGTKPPIVLGSVGEQTGIAGSAIADGPRAVAAWVASINATGGIQCHPLKYVIADDGADPSRNQALTQQLVEQQHVVAFVHNDAPLASTGSEAYLASHNIPVIGSEGASEFYYHHPTFYPQQPTGNALVYIAFAAMAAGLTPDQRAHAGLLTCSEAQECAVFGQLGPGYGKELGLNFVYVGTASLAAPDFTSQCLGAKNAGATAFFVVLDPNSIHRAARSCASVGYKPQLVTGAPVTVPSLADDPNLDGMLIGGPVIPWFINSNPQVANYLAVLKKYAPGVPPDGASIAGWTSAQLLATALKSVTLPDTVTTADINKAMATIKNNDLGGITGPLTFTAGQNATPVRCWYVIKLINKQFTSPDGGRRACA